MYKESFLVKRCEKWQNIVCLYKWACSKFHLFRDIGWNDARDVHSNSWYQLVDINVQLEFSWYECSPLRLQFSVIISLVDHVYIENIYFCQVYNKLLLLLSLIWCWHLNLKLVIWFWSWEFYIIPLKADVLPIGLLSKFATSPFEAQKAVYFVYRLKTR